MSPLTREEVLLQEWVSSEETIRNLDNILTTIRFYGSAGVVAVMGAAAEALRAREHLVICGVDLRVSVLIQSLSVMFVLAMWFLHSHYAGFLSQVVGRQRQIEELLVIQGQQVLHLGRSVTRSGLKWYLRNPQQLLFLLLLGLGLVLVIVYSVAMLG